MIVKILLAILQFLLFFIAFAVGSFMTPFKIMHIIAFSPRGTRIFYWDGIIVMLIVYVVILLVEAMRKRLRTAAGWDYGRVFARNRSRTRRKTRLPRIHAQAENLA